MIVPVPVHCFSLTFKYFFYRVQLLLREKSVVYQDVNRKINHTFLIWFNLLYGK